jgi:hypothetical protein
MKFPSGQERGIVSADGPVAPRTQGPDMKWLLVTGVCGLSIMANGCNRKPEPLPPTIEAAQLTTADSEVLDVVARDLMGNKEFNPQISGSATAKALLVVDKATPGAATGIARHCNAPSLPAAVVSEMRQDLLNRNPAGRRFSLSTYRPNDPLIQIRDLGGADVDLEFEAVFPGARGYIQPYLPGYSRDGKAAMVGFGFGPTAHEAAGWYVVTWENGAWKIQHRFLGYLN